MIRNAIRVVSLVLVASWTNAHGYQLNQHWTLTATDGNASGQGRPVTLTWGFLPDGVQTSGGGASNLINFLDNTYGMGAGGGDFTLRPWFDLFSESFGRWGELTGNTYVYEPNDDGAVMSQNNRGILGVRADLRVGGRNIDGPGGVLAFNNFPNYGDMVIDTADGGLFGSAVNDFRYFRNVLMHEHGHGMGLNHVESSDRRFLMEPFIQTNFDGPQLDDILGAQRHYGDFFERNGGNDTAAAATSLGTLVSGSTVSIGTHAATGTLVNRPETDFISIDDNSDIDYLSFDLTAASTVDLTLTPRGVTYRQGPQGGSQSIFNAAALSDLTLALFDADGTTLLQSSNVTGLGGTESISGFTLNTAGTYYARVTGAANEIQLYQLDVTATNLAQLGDFDGNGLFECADIDALVANVAAGGGTLSFDLTGDGLVNFDDVTEWLALAGDANLPSGTPYLPGDANLDGNVDGTDFGIWNANKFDAVNAWCLGDFNADGNADGSDFGIWNIHKFTSADSSLSAVPEPHGLAVLMGLAVGILGRRRRSS